MRWTRRVLTNCHYCIAYTFYLIEDFDFRFRRFRIFFRTFLNTAKSSDSLQSSRINQKGSFQNPAHFHRPQSTQQSGPRNELGWAERCTKQKENKGSPTACGMWNPGPGIEPVCPTLAGGFLTIGPPGKSKMKHFCRNSFANHQSKSMTVNDKKETFK